MKRPVVLTVILLLVAAAVAGCARIYPPAERLDGPTPTAVVQAPAVPHGTAGMGDCLACHATGSNFLASLQASHPVPLPPGFQGSAAEACQVCHSMEPGHILARAMPHPVEGWQDCLACHAGGGAGMPQTPPDHGGYAADRCTLCHAPVGASSAVAQAPGASVIPHDLAGMDNCLGCHGGGLPGMPAVPADHDGRGNQTCVACHK